jgi:hypothetical protein
MPFYITFPERYRTEAHPFADVEPDGYVRVEADDREEAEFRAYSVFSAYYQAILDESELDPAEFPLGELYSV